MALAHSEPAVPDIARLLSYTSCSYPTDEEMDARMKEHAAETRALVKLEGDLSLAFDKLQLAAVGLREHGIHGSEHEFDQLGYDLFESAMRDLARLLRAAV